MAVSYTHLDVYKRQALRFFIQKLVQKMLPIIYKCFGDNVAVRIFIPVSYTHLWPPAAPVFGLSVRQYGFHFPQPAVRQDGQMLCCF